MNGILMKQEKVTVANEGAPRFRADQVGHALAFTIERECLMAVGSGHFVVQFYLYDEVPDESGLCHRWGKPIPVQAGKDHIVGDHFNGVGLR
jgi:hypothetical protein